MLRLVKNKVPGIVNQLEGRSARFWKTHKHHVATAPKTEVVVPDVADVVIIGGGTAGCHTLYQLTKRGIKAVLLERAKLISGTTWHTAGCIWRLRPNDIDTLLLNGTRDVLMTLEAETGYDPGWIMNGGIFVANNEERMNEYRRLSTIGRSFGIESHILDPKETQKLFPLINPDAIVGSIYSPGDGVVDPAMLCTALTKHATKKGGKVIENCPVSEILTKKNEFGTKKVAGVVTPFGTIKTDCIVNCCGVWAREIAAMVGLHLPLVPMKHAYIVSESVPEVRGLPNIRDHDASTYFRIQGESICMGGYEYNPILLDQVPSDFEFSLYELDWSVFSFSMQGAVKLMPKYETLGVKTTVCGPESFTPDHKPILGNTLSLYIGEECIACREEAAIFDMSSLGKYYLSGPEAQKAADWIFTANTRRPLGRTVYTCILNSKAGVEGDITASAIETGKGTQIDPIFKKFNVDFSDVSDQVGVLSIQGPNSRDILQPLVDTELSNEAFPYSTTKLVNLAGHLCRAIRVSFVGELGWEFHIPQNSCSAVYKAIWQQGNKHGLRNAGYRTLQSLSCEKGHHLWHFDLQTSDNPLEAGLSFICRKTGDYLGKAALDVIRQKGLAKQLVSFHLKDYVKHPEGRRVTPSFLSEGHYQIEVMGKRYDATLHIKSPFDPNGKRLLGIYEDPLPIRQ
ncbi:hypothetical protein C0J52_25788 [Blattella germanica]|nr:hypothetical protein C0J52_25788 [Blattella germanica]